MKTSLRFTKTFLIIFIKILAKTIPIWGMILLALFGLVLVFAKIEGLDFTNAFYFGCITALTIGYGDITPLTRMGKALAIIMGIMGVINTGIIVAIALQAMRVTYDEMIEKAKEYLEQTLSDKGNLPG